MLMVKEEGVISCARHYRPMLEDWYDEKAREMMLEMEERGSEGSPVDVSGEGF
jgi:hypothetical protein